jgi:hypothetical protein
MPPGRIGQNFSLCRSSLGFRQGAPDSDDLGTSKKALCGVALRHRVEGSTRCALTLPIIRTIKPKTVPGAWRGFGRLLSGRMGWPAAPRQAGGRPDQCKSGCRRSRGLFPFPAVPGTDVASDRERESLASMRVSGVCSRCSRCSRCFLHRTRSASRFGSFLPSIPPSRATPEVEFGGGSEAGLGATLGATFVRKCRFTQALRFLSEDQQEQPLNAGTAGRHGGRDSVPGV